MNVNCMQRFLHFKTNDAEYCMVGSANATLAGLGTITHRGINEEFGVLYHSTKQDFLSTLGLKTKKRIDVPTKDPNILMKLLLKLEDD